jgi:hypothetical protein
LEGEEKVFILRELLCGIAEDDSGRMNLADHARRFQKTAPTRRLIVA